MNQDTLDTIIQRLDELSENMTQIQKKIAGLTIDNQMIVKKDANVTPGIACKVAYNADGLIVGTDKLAKEDIPKLSIDHINGLRDTLTKAFANVNTPTVDTDKLFNRGDISGTACKVNYDDHGLIINSSPLLPEDIPVLPIKHIEGLSEIIDRINMISNQPEKNNYKQLSGCKFKTDSNGRIISADKLLLTDMPNELLTKINLIESSCIDSASTKSVDNLKSVLNNKVTSNPDIKPGIYTKVTVDAKGLVLQGDELSIEDLPEIGIDDISGLRKELNGYVSVNVFNSLKNNLTEYMNSININKITDAVKSQINISATNNDDTKINQLQESIETVKRQLPPEGLVRQVENLSREFNEFKSNVIKVLHNSHINF